MMAANSLRIGFMLSGLLHMAMVAAFTQSSNRPVPVVDEPSPLSLKLSAFKPPEPAPEIRPAPQIPQEQVAVREPEPLAPEEPLPEVEPPPVEPVVEARPEPEPAKPVVVEQPKPKPVPERVVKPEVKKKRPPVVRAAVPVPVAVAATETERPPQPEVPRIDAQKRQHYLAALAARINRNKYYPRASRRRGEEGTVVVSFVIQRNGELSDFVVTESSGHERLDTAALKTLRRVTPFKPIPDVIGRDQWPISVPIAFSLGG